MTKLIAPGVNCFQCFLAAMLDIPLSSVANCSTENHDYQEHTQKVLERFDSYIVEIIPSFSSGLPDGQLVGAQVPGLAKGQPHIVIGRVVRQGNKETFYVHHDPNGQYPAGGAIEPESIVLLCKLIR
jgi:hypothetical protein